MLALALTDHDALYGVVPFVQAAQACGIRPIVGAEVTLDDGHHLTLLVQNHTGWRNLCWLISQGQANAPKGQAALPWSALDDHTNGLIALSGCRHGPVAAALLRWDRTAAFRAAKRLRDLFGVENCYIELQHHLRPDDDPLVNSLVSLAQHLRLGYVATNNVHYATRDGKSLQDVLVAIKRRILVGRASTALRPNGEYYLKSRWQFLPILGKYPDALSTTEQIAERCEFKLTYGVQDLPIFPTPVGATAIDYLAKLCHEGLRWRYRAVPERACVQLEYELAVIERTNLANYFLVVWDIVRFARQRGIRCQGRGSAANSLVAYALGISPIDPLAHDLVFERFLSDERPDLPDCDIDFAADRREEVIRYVYDRYGFNYAAMACTFVTFRARSVVRNIADAFALPPDLQAQVEQIVDTNQPAASGTLHLVAELCKQIEGLPRHLGQHNGGMIVMGTPLAERLPVEPAAMAGRIVCQWDKDALEEAGLIKIDILGLRMLSAITEAVTLIATTAGTRIDLDRLTFDDKAVYDRITKADTIGIYQLESPAQTQILPLLRPTCFNDLIISISLIRPGPLQADMAHPFLRRRQRLEPVSYKHPLLKPALEETLGVILFQEQTLKVAKAIAGFTGGQGEQLRRALGSKEPGEAIEQLRGAFLAGAATRGIPKTVAEAIFEQLRAFGGYSFPKSHAAAFAVLVYQSAWLKYYYPAAFLCGLLNSQPMGYWPPAVLVTDANRHGVEVFSVDIEQSAVRCSIEQGCVQLGWNYIKGLGSAGAQRIVDERQVRPFVSLADFCERTQLPRRIVERLVRAGVLDSWRQPRRQLLWELGTLRYQEAELDLKEPSSPVSLPPLTRMEAHAAEIEVQGLSTGEHVMSFYRHWLDEQGILGSTDLENCDDGQRVQIAGLCIAHQAPPTARGYHFLTLDDQAGFMSVIVSPGLALRVGRHLRTGRVLVIEGVVQWEAGVINLLAQRIGPLGVD